MTRTLILHARLQVIADEIEQYKLETPPVGLGGPIKVMILPLEGASEQWIALEVRVVYQQQLSENMLYSPLPHVVAEFSLTKQGDNCKLEYTFQYSVQTNRAWFKFHVEQLLDTLEAKYTMPEENKAQARLGVPTEKGVGKAEKQNNKDPRGRGRPKETIDPINLWACKQVFERGRPEDEVYLEWLKKKEKQLSKSPARRDGLEDPREAFKTALRRYKKKTNRQQFELFLSVC